MNSDTYVEQHRRRHTRIEVDGDVPIVDTTMGVTMTLWDISYGGCRTESPLPFQPGARHLFAFTCGEHATVELEARVIHCYTAPEHPGHYVIGWLWLDVPVNIASVGRLVRYLTTVQGYAADARLN